MSDFTYSNLSGRPTSRFLRVARKLLSGVDKVESEIAPYAAQWHERNVIALGGTEPLWVVLGDSISQGIGASSIEQGWVLQAWRTLADLGIHYRIVNLSISGATVGDVIDRELPAMNGLAASPALVTVFIGSNDIIHHDLRVTLADHYSALLAALPAGSLVAVTGGARGALAEVDRLVAADGSVVPVLVHFAPGQRAEDHFHPNDAGYSQIAADFVRVIAGRDAAAGD